MSQLLRYFGLGPARRPRRKRTRRAEGERKRKTRGRTGPRSRRRRDKRGRFVRAS